MTAEPLPRSSPSARRGWALSSFLLLVTFATTLLTGFEWEASSRGVRVESFGEILAQPSLLLLGLPYSLSLLAILGTHEMGHYIACRRYGIDSTPPYFLPSPPGMLFGTFGAFIRIRAPITDRRALFDIGVAGPLAGAVVAVPVLIAGILGSRWIPDPGALEGSTAYIFGNSMIISAAESIFAAPPPPGEGYVLAHSSMIFAGWVGLLATALNLLPVGQLDGGHIAYSLSMRFHRYLSRLCLAGFVVLGLTVNEAWLFWATLIIFFSPGHPRLVEERTVLTRARRLVAILAGIILIACFVPSPIRIVG